MVVAFNEARLYTCSEKGNRYERYGEVEELEEAQSLLLAAVPRHVWKDHLCLDWGARSGSKECSELKKLIAHHSIDSEAGVGHKWQSIIKVRPIDPAV